MRKFWNRGARVAARETRARHKHARQHDWSLRASDSARAPAIRPASALRRLGAQSYRVSEALAHARNFADILLKPRVEADFPLRDLRGFGRLGTRPCPFPRPRRAEKKNRPRKNLRRSREPLRWLDATCQFRSEEHTSELQSHSFIS